MLRRRIFLVLGLSLGDYALWSWASAYGHQVIALVSGVLLTALMLWLAWVLGVAVVRLLFGSMRRGVASPLLAEQARRGAARLRMARQRGLLGRQIRGAPADPRRAATAAPTPIRSELPGGSREMAKTGVRRRRSAGMRLRRGLSIPARIAPRGRERAGSAAAPAGVSAPPPDRLAA